MNPEHRPAGPVERYARWIVHWRWPALAATLLFAIFAASGARFLSFDNDYRVFFSEDNPQLQAFEELQDVYIKNDNVLFGLSSPGRDAFHPAVLEAVRNLTESAWELPYAIRVDALTNFQHTRADGDDLAVGDLVTRTYSLSPDQRDYIRDVAMSEPMLYRRLVSEDGNVTGVNVTFQFPGKDTAEVPEVVEAARSLAERISALHPEVEVRASGTVMLNNAFQESSQSDMATLVPLMYLGIIVVMWLLLRSFTATLGSVLVVALSVVTAMGLAGWMGVLLTPPSASAPTVIMTLAVADAIHLLVSQFTAMRSGLAKREALIESLRINFTPILLTSVTTAIGFLTMNFSDAPPFHDLGNITAIGVMAALFYSVTFLPAFLAVVPIRASKATNRYASAMDRLAEIVVTRRGVVLGASAAAALVLLSFVPRNELNDQFVEYFDTSVPFRVNADWTMENLTGLYQLQYSIPAGEPNGVSDPAFLQRLDGFAEWLRSRNEVVHVSAISDTFKRLNRNMHGDDPDWHRLPRNRELAAQYLLLYELSLPFGLDLNNQLNIDKSSTQLVATMQNLSAGEIREFAARSEAWLAANAPQQFTHAAGTAVMFAHISERNIRSMLLGTFLGLLLISAILLVALRSWKLGLVSLLPNLLPAGLAFGVWGLMVGQVNMAVSVVTGMTLGIVVDDTVHFLSKYVRARRERGLDAPDAVRYAFSSVGVALVVTTLILVAGFTILSQSAFQVNSAMAAMTATAIGLALAADFTLLPAILMRLDRRRTTDSIKIMEQRNEQAFATY